MSVDPSFQGRSQHHFAIVGMASEFPGAADADALWKVLQNGLNTVSQIPQDRFDIAQFSSGAQTLGRAMRTSHGNFIKNADAFDNVFFHISPREARSMDPQQRLLLRVGYHALENAGYSPDATPCFNPITFATFVGVATSDYVHNLRNDIDVYYSTGTLQAFLSGRLAYAFGFEGPSIVFDTACSSSMVAIHQACRALQNGDCDAALAGGVSVITSPDMYLGLARGHFLSDTGQCRPWDASADGYCRSEGCGLFVLKRLDDALAENDRILGVIRGIEIGQSGNAHSITRPHTPSQVTLFRKLVTSAGIRPDDVSVAECHGTGTQAGDVTEVEAVRKVFAVDRTADNPLYLTSVKANIGHAEAASGSASLTKLLLMMREKAIPRHVSFQQLNPRVPDLSSDNIEINTMNVLWPSERNRLALLTNFGAAGSNAALILEEHDPPPRRTDDNRRTGVVIGLSCRSTDAAEKRRAAYVNQLEGVVPTQSALEDFAYSATARRQLHRYRIAVSGCSREEVLQSLRAAKITEVAPSENVLFVFSGQGSQYVGMGAELYRELPFVASIVDQCDRKLMGWGFVGVVDVIRGTTKDSLGAADIRHVQAMQTALFVLEYALAALWMSWGVRPVAVVGHSFGEFAAMVISGVLTLDDALRLVATRAQLVVERCHLYRTGMCSIRVSAEQLELLLSGLSELTTCCFNSTSHCTIGGSLQQLEVLERRCSAEGIRCTRLDVPYAYHSDAMDPVSEGLSELGGKIKMSPPTIPILSNVSGTVIRPGDQSRFTPDYFARHCREPARFHGGISDLQSCIDLLTVAACIEIGPHPTTLSLLRDIKRDGAPLLLPSLRRNVPTFEVLCGTLAQLYCTSVRVQWRKVFADLAPDARLVELPAYPFADTRFWVPYEEGSRLAKSALSPHETSAHPVDVISTGEPADAFIFDVELGDLAELIQGHRVAGVALCPASVYVDLVLSGALSALKKRSLWTTGDVLDLAVVTFPKPLVYSPERTARLRVEITVFSSTHRYAGSFAVTSTSEGNKAQIHCVGSFKRTTTEGRTLKFLCDCRMVEREIERISSSSKTETFGTRTVYELLFPQIITYSDAYWTIRTMIFDAVSSTAYATIQLPKAKPTPALLGPSQAHPIFIDTLFHVAGFLVNFLLGMNERDVFICSGVDKVKLIPTVIDTSARYGVYASVVRAEDTLAVMDVFAVEVDDGQHRIVACLRRVQFRRTGLRRFRKMLALSASTSLGTTLPPSADDIRAFVVDAALPTDSVRDLEREVICVISETTGIPKEDVTLDVQLSHLGVDSLMNWELVARLRDLYPARVLDVSALAGALSVRDLVCIIAEMHGATGGVPTSATESTLCGTESGEPADGLSLDAAAPSVEAGSVHLDRPVDSVTIKGILSSVLDVPMVDITDDADLASLGLDSLTSIEAQHFFRTRLGVCVDAEALLACQTVRDISDAASALYEPAQQHTTRPSPELLRLQSTPGGVGGTTPLILVHDGSGLIGGYARLAPLARDVWGIQNTALVGTHGTPVAERGGELVQLATVYAELIAKALFGEGCASPKECFVGGWSFGGVVAYEVARQLRPLGVQVKGLILVDAPTPQTSSPLPDALVESVIGNSALSTRTKELVRTQMKHAMRMLSAYDPSTRQTQTTYDLPDAVYLRSRSGAELGELECDHKVRAFLTKEGDEWTIAGWEQALGTKVIVLEIPGDHFAVFDEDNVGAVSEQLKMAAELLSSRR